MLKKIVVGTLLVGLIGLLVFGAVNRTMDKTGKEAQAQGQGLGRGRCSEELASGQGDGRDRSIEELGARDGNGQGAGRRGGVEALYPDQERDELGRPVWAGRGGRSL
jgi:hypothetical protein